MASWYCQCLPHCYLYYMHPSCFLAGEAYPVHISFYISIASSKSFSRPRFYFPHFSISIFISSFHFLHSSLPEKEQGTVSNITGIYRHSTAYYGFTRAVSTTNLFSALCTCASKVLRRTHAPCNEAHPKYYTV